MNRGLLHRQAWHRSHLARSVLLADELRTAVGIKERSLDCRCDALPVPTVPTVPLLHADVLRGAAHFDTLAPEWQAAVDRMARPSLFVTPTFLRIAWQHLAETDDEPWFVVVRRQGELVGLLPLVRQREPSSRLLRHVLVHMGLLGGDRPGLVHTVPADAVWQAALAALQAQRRHWQVLDLRELDADAWPVRQAASRGGAHWRCEPSTEAGALRLEGTWDDYLAQRSRNTRQGFRRVERRLHEAHPEVRIDVADRADTVDAALDRYFAIDARSWKREANVEFWSDAREAAALRATVRALAASGQASVWLLAAGPGDTRDMAGLVRLRQGSVVYERCATYDPAHAAFSPSTYLCMQAVRRSFGAGCDESDVLGLPGPLAERPAIHAWYPLVRRTWRVQVVNGPWWWPVVQAWQQPRVPRLSLVPVGLAWMPRAPAPQISRTA